MNFNEIKKAVGERIADPIGFCCYAECDSTNLRAREFAREHPENRTPYVFIAEGQTAGRGRRGRSFESPMGAGLYISLLTYPKGRGAEATALTAQAALELAHAIEATVACEVKIKWVNDLILGGRKVAGILTEAEMSSEGEAAFLITGMGINICKNVQPRAALRKLHSCGSMLSHFQMLKAQAQLKWLLIIPRVKAKMQLLFPQQSQLQ